VPVFEQLNGHRFVPIFCGEDIAGVGAVEMDAIAISDLVSDVSFINKRECITM
jgi:hypothetical protein